ncbi:MAG: hypothetical protein JSR82_05135 [Verrucomicrobia bacterium]|nr:hypothetical protein [Verrucomicrobiota bacterium]
MPSLAQLRERFLATSTVSMPIAGLIVWSAIGLAALFVSKSVVGWLAVYSMPVIMPLAFVLEKLRGRPPFVRDDNPISKLFFQSIIGIGLLFPLVIGTAEAARDPNIIVLGIAILSGVIWIPYGWGADDPVGLRHAIGRAVGSYLVFWLAPAEFKATGICAVVALAYLYSLAAMKKPAA